jgi:signal peptidase I
MKKKRKGANGPLSPGQIIENRRRKLRDRQTVVLFLERLVLFVFMLWLLFGKFFGLTGMVGEDMKPRVSSGDLLLYYRMETVWHANDLVVIKKDGRQYVGRIAAQSGDSVDITDDAEVKINGSQIVEPEIYYTTPRYEGRVTYPVTLGENEFFILCDFREGAKDSRYYGVVSGGEIQGKVITVIRRSNL